MPYKRLYDTTCEFLTNYDTWMNSMIGSYEPEAIETATAVAYRIIYKLERSVQESIAKRLVETVRTKIEEFKEHMPVIATLGNPSLKSRHWEQISEIVGFPIKVDESMTLAKVTHILFLLNESIRIRSNLFDSIIRRRVSLEYI